MIDFTSFARGSAINDQVRSAIDLLLFRKTCEARVRKRK